MPAGDGHPEPVRHIIGVLPSAISRQNARSTCRAGSVGPVSAPLVEAPDPLPALVAPSGHTFICRGVLPRSVEFAATETSSTIALERAHRTPESEVTNVPISPVPWTASVPCASQPIKAARASET